MAGTDDQPELETPENEDDLGQTQQENGDTGTEKGERNIKLPITRIKHIIKMDPDVNLASQDAVILLAKAAELFVHEITKEAFGFTAQTKRKTVHKKDLDLAIDQTDSLAFLEGCFES